MNKVIALVIATISGVAVIGIPILIAVKLADQQSLEVEKEQALAIAREVMRRAEQVGDQAEIATRRLKAMQMVDPCSDDGITAMRSLAVGSSYLQMVGYVSNGLVLCSSLGRHAPGLALGPVDYVSPRGVAIRTSVYFPFAPYSRLVVAQRDGFAAAIHPDLPVDVFLDRSDISVSIYGKSSGRVLVRRGNFEPAWQRLLGKNQSTALFDGRHVIGVVSSTRYDYASIAAIPVAYVNARARSFAALLSPVGALVGIGFASLLLLLVRQQLSLPAAIRSALRRNEFFMVYQPIVALDSGRCIGAEALLRWRRADGTLIRPDLFIPVAEDSGLIRLVTKRVMTLVATDLADMMRRYPDFHISFNLSALDLQSPDIVIALQEFVRFVNARPENIVVEATERGFLQTDTARHILQAIRRLGVQIAIDDFGTGYSSLSYLTTLQVDYLKIDKAFVDAIDTDAATSQVALHIIKMAGSLKLAIIAEGVETESQAIFLRQHGVEFAQGWLFGKPMSIRDLIERLQAQRDAPTTQTHET